MSNEQRMLRIKEVINTLNDKIQRGIALSEREISIVSAVDAIMETYDRKEQRLKDINTNNSYNIKHSSR